MLALAALAILFFALPLVGLLWRAPWSNAWGYLTDDNALTALRLSLICSLWATALSVLFGVPLAWVLARVSFPGRGAVRALAGQRGVPVAGVHGAGAEADPAHHHLGGVSGGMDRPLDLFGYLGQAPCGQV